jgi:hypothetical protein
MSERYWEAGGTPDLDEVLYDWVNENVLAAIRDFWEEQPVSWVGVKDGRMILTVCGPGKPTEDDPSGQNNIYVARFDLVKELTDYSDPYEGLSGCSDAQREDMRERAAALRKLADDVAALAARAAEAGN